MSYDDGDERVERNMHGITYRANASENRRVVSRVVASPEWLQWAWRDDLVKCVGAGEYHASAMEDRCNSKAGLHWICREANEWFQKLAELTVQEIEAMEADR